MASRCIAISARDSIIHEVEESLRRLGTDYIDLYITHWQDPTTPIEETVAALEELKKAGQDPRDRREQRQPFGTRTVYLPPGRSMRSRSGSA
jgi:hypothetical protein